MLLTDVDKLKLLSAELEDEIYEVAEELIDSSSILETVISRLTYLEPYTSIICKHLLRFSEKALLTGEGIAEMKVAVNMANRLSDTVKVLRHLYNDEKDLHLIQGILDDELNSKELFKSSNAFTKICVKLNKDVTTTTNEVVTLLVHKANRSLQVLVTIMYIFKTSNDYKKTADMCKEQVTTELSNLAKTKEEINSYFNGLKLFSETIDGISISSIYMAMQIIEDLIYEISQDNISRDYYEVLEDIFSVIEQTSNLDIISSATKSIEIIVLETVEESY